MTLDLPHEFANTEVFLLGSQLLVAIQTLWSQCLFPRAVWTNRWTVHSQVSPCLFDLRLRFRLRLCLHINVQQTLAHNSSKESPCLRWCFRSQTRHLFRFPEQANQMIAHSSQVYPCLIIGFLILDGFVGSIHYLQQLLNPIRSSNFFKGNLRRKSRWRILSPIWPFQFPSQ